MFGPVQGSVSYGQDDQWAAAVTLGGDYGDWSGWTRRRLHAARRRLGLQHRGRQRRLRLRRLRLGPARPDRPQPDALDRRPEARRGRRPVEPLRQARLGHRVLGARPDRLRHRLHQRREHQRRRRRGHVLGHRRGAADRALRHRSLRPAPPVLLSTAQPTRISGTSPSAPSAPSSPSDPRFAERRAVWVTPRGRRRFPSRDALRLQCLGGRFASRPSATRRRCRAGSARGKARSGHRRRCRRSRRAV